MTETIDFMVIEAALKKARRDNDAVSKHIIDEWFKNKLDRSMKLVSMPDRSMDDYEGF